MKTLINSLFGLLIIFCAAMTVASCDPCATAVCENGSCSNGTCVCEPFYEKTGIECIGINQPYTSESDTVSATVTTVVGTGAPQTTSNVQYVITAPKATPRNFSLLHFASITSNDIKFTVSETNYDVVKALTAITPAAKSYDVSGSRVGSQVQLVIKDIPTSTTYTIVYSTN